MVAFPVFQTPPQFGSEAMTLSKGRARATARRRWSGWMIWPALAVALAAGPALPQAGVALVKVDLSGRGEGLPGEQADRQHRHNDKNEKIGTLDDIMRTRTRSSLSFAVLQVGGFLGVGGRLVVVPYESLVIDETRHEDHPARRVEGRAEKAVRIQLSGMIETAAWKSRMQTSSDEILDRMRTREVTGVFHSRKALDRRCGGSSVSGSRPRRYRCQRLGRRGGPPLELRVSSSGRPCRYAGDRHASLS